MDAISLITTSLCISLALETYFLIKEWLTGKRRQAVSQLANMAVSVLCYVFSLYVIDPGNVASLLGVSGQLLSLEEAIDRANSALRVISESFASSLSSYSLAVAVQSAVSVSLSSLPQDISEMILPLLSYIEPASCVFRTLTSICGYLSLAAYVLILLLMLAKQLGKVMLNLGASLIIIRFTRRIGLVMLAWGLALCCILPLLTNLALPAIKYAEDVQKSAFPRLGYLILEVRGLPRYSVLLLEKVDENCSCNLKRLFAVNINQSRKIILLPIGKYRIKGLLVYWTLIRHPKITNRSFKVLELNKTIVKIDFEEIDINANEEGLAGGLSLCLLNGKRIKPQNTKKGLKYSALLVAGDILEVWNIGGEPQISKTPSAGLDIRVIKDNNLPNWISYAEGVKLAEYIHIEYARWWKRVIGLTVNDLWEKYANVSGNIISPSTIVRIKRYLSKMRPLWWHPYLKINHMLILAYAVNETGYKDFLEVTIYIPRSNYWNLSYLFLNPQWSYLTEKGANSGVSAILSLPTIIIEFVISFLALDALAAMLGAPSFTSTVAMPAYAAVLHSLSVASSSVRYYFNQIIRRKMPFLKALDAKPSLSRILERTLSRRLSRIRSDIERLERESLKVREVVAQDISKEYCWFRSRGRKLTPIEAVSKESLRELKREVISSSKGDLQLTAACALLAEGVLKGEEWAFPIALQLKKFLALTDALERLTTIKHGTVQRLKSLFSLYVHSLSRGRVEEAKHRLRILEKEVHRVISTLTPFELKLVASELSEIGILGPYRIITESNRLKSTLISTDWLSYTYHVAKKFREEGLKYANEVLKLIDRAVFSDLSIHYPDILTSLRLLFKEIKRKNLKTIEIEKVLNSAERALFYLPPWIAGDLNKDFANAVGKYVFVHACKLPSVKSLLHYVLLEYSRFLHKDFELKELYIIFSNMHVYEKYVRSVRKAKEILELVIKEEAYEAISEVYDALNMAIDSLIQLNNICVSEGVNPKFVRRQLRNLRELISQISTLEEEMGGYAEG